MANHNIPPELQHIYYPVMHTIEEWCDSIFAHFDQGRITGGFVESANGIARCLSRMGRGTAYQSYERVCCTA